MSSQKYLGYKKAIEKIPINVKSLPSLCVLRPGHGTALCSVLRMWSLDPCHLFCTFLITWRKGANSSTYDDKNLKFDIRSFRYVHKYLLWKWLHSYYCIYLLWIRQRPSCCLDDILIHLQFCIRTVYGDTQGILIHTKEVRYTITWNLSKQGKHTMQVLLLASGFSNQLSQDQNVISYNSGKIRNLEHTVT